MLASLTTSRYLAISSNSKSLIFQGLNLLLLRILANLNRPDVKRIATHGDRLELLLPLKLQESTFSE
jgi:hypothetical protein